MDDYLADCWRASPYAGSRGIKEEALLSLLHSCDFDFGRARHAHSLLVQGTIDSSAVPWRNEWRHSSWLGTPPPRSTHALLGPWTREHPSTCVLQRRSNGNLELTSANFPCWLITCSRRSCMAESMGGNCKRRAERTRSSVESNVSSPNRGRACMASKLHRHPAYPLRKRRCVRLGWLAPCVRVHRQVLQTRLTSNHRHTASHLTRTFVALRLGFRPIVAGASDDMSAESFFEPYAVEDMPFIGMAAAVLLVALEESSSAAKRAKQTDKVPSNCANCLNTVATKDHPLPQLQARPSVTAAPCSRIEPRFRILRRLACAMFATSFSLSLRRSG